MVVQKEEVKSVHKQRECHLVRTRIWFLVPVNEIHCLVAWSFLSRVAAFNGGEEKS